MVGQCRDGENWPCSAMSCSPGFFSTCAFETWNLSIILPTYRGYFTQIEEITQSAAPSVEALDKQLKGERNRKGESRPTKHRTLGEEKKLMIICLSSRKKGGRKRVTHEQSLTFQQ